MFCIHIPLLNFLAGTLLVFGNYSWFEAINTLPNPLIALLKITTSPALLFTLYLTNFLHYWQVFTRINKWTSLFLAATLINLIRPHHYVRLTYSLPLNVGLENPLAQIHPPLLFLATLSLLYVAGVILVNGRQRVWFTRFKLLPALIISFTLSCLWAYQELFWGSFWNWDPVEFSYLILILLTGTISHLFTTAQPPRVKNFALLLLLPTVWCLKFLNLGPTTQSVHSFNTSPVGYWGQTNVYRFITTILLLLTITQLGLLNAVGKAAAPLQKLSTYALTLATGVYISAHLVQNNLQLKTAILSHNLFIKIFHITFTALITWFWVVGKPKPRQLKLPPTSHLLPILLLITLCSVWYLEKRTTLWNTHTYNYHLRHHALNTVEYNVTSINHNSLYYSDRRYLPSWKVKHKHLQTLNNGVVAAVSTIYHIPNSANSLIYLNDSPVNYAKLYVRSSPIY